MNRWCQSFIPVVVLALLFFLSGCAADGGNSAKKGSAKPETAVQPYLITPESTEDLTNVTDADLDWRISEKRKLIHQLMGKTFDYRFDHGNVDLSRDAKFQALFHQIKQSETDLDVLKREVARRGVALIKN